MGGIGDNGALLTALFIIIIGIIPTDIYSAFLITTVGIIPTNQNHLSVSYTNDVGIIPTSRPGLFAAIQPSPSCNSIHPRQTGHIPPDVPGVGWGIQFNFELEFQFEI